MVPAHTHTSAHRAVPLTYHKFLSTGAGSLNSSECNGVEFRKQLPQVLHRLIRVALQLLNVVYDGIVVHLVRLDHLVPQIYNLIHDFDRRFVLLVNCNVFDLGAAAMHRPSSDIYFNNSSNLLGKKSCVPAARACMPRIAGTYVNLQESKHVFFVGQLGSTGTHECLTQLLTACHRSSQHQSRSTPVLITEFTTHPA
jgi:hypothetical protein